MIIDINLPPVRLADIEREIEKIEARRVGASGALSAMIVLGLTVFAIVHWKIVDAKWIEALQWCAVVAGILSALELHRCDVLLHELSAVDEEDRAELLTYSHSSAVAAAYHQAVLSQSRLMINAEFEAMETWHWQQAHTNREQKQRGAVENV